MAPRSNITLRIDAEDAEAVQSFLKLTRAERNLEVQTRKTNAAMVDKEVQSKRVSKELFGVSKSALKAVGGMIGIGTAASAFATVTREIERMDQALVESAKKANAQGRGLREFAALQAPGKEGQKFVRETLLKAAEYGVSPEQAAQVAQPIQSLADKDGNGILSATERKEYEPDFGASLGLIQSGVASEDALRVITAGRARSQSGAESADLLIRASETSAQGPATFARSISSTGEFSDQKEALSILSALTKEQTDPGKLPAAMERLGLVLGKVGEEGETGKFTKKFGLAGMAETEKVDALRQYGAANGQGATEDDRVRDFTAKLPNEKGLSKEQAIDLARVVRQAESATGTRGILENDSVGRLDAARAKLMADPITRGAILEDRQKAIAENVDLMGPQAVDAQARLGKRQMEGAKALAKGDVDAVTPSGELKQGSELGWMSWFGAKANGFMSSTGAGVGYGAGPNGEVVGRENQRIQAERDAAISGSGVQYQQEALVQVMRENNELLRANIAATQGNTNANAAKAPAGGARSNAEEAY